MASGRIPEAKTFPGRSKCLVDIDMNGNIPFIERDTRKHCWQNYSRMIAGLNREQIGTRSLFFNI